MASCLPSPVQQGHHFHAAEPWEPRRGLTASPGIYNFRANRKAPLHPSRVHPRNPSGSLGANACERLARFLWTVSVFGHFKHHRLSKSGRSALNMSRAGQGAIRLAHSDGSVRCVSFMVLLSQGNGIPSHGERTFKDLSEQEILALAISLEETDGRIYADFADGSRKRIFPRSAKRLHRDGGRGERQHRRWIDRRAQAPLRGSHPAASGARIYAAS